ncbi:hypothetical protein BDZ85DRAFT_267912 [Elsinoe ampelina]|uniref:Short chain dehydrogenase n=1 Tax=Elsinoe ampelina TaxID=302913 RepID=A0A6A6G3H2_9PEZI|nr:hypothetical protein BDZ85DRAFT_267912 [Elsinoe ampelina]
MPSVLVTGASRGLGYAFTQFYASQPDNTVLALVRNKSATEARLAKDGITNVHVLSADITDASAVQAAADETSKITGGSLDILINNAGLSGDDASAFLPLVDLTPDEIQQYFTASFQANVIGIAITTNAFLPLIRKGTTKKVITISTGMADVDLVTQYDISSSTSYAVSKIGTNMLVAKYHAALGKSEGILFLAMSPGFVDTSEGKVPSKEQIEGMQAMAAKFADYAPDFKGPITPEESVRMVDEVVRGATVESLGGAFVSHHGNKQWL